MHDILFSLNWKSLYIISELGELGKQITFLLAKCQCHCKCSSARLCCPLRPCSPEWPLTETSKLPQQMPKQNSEEILQSVAKEKYQNCQSAKWKAKGKRKKVAQWIETEAHFNRCKRLLLFICVHVCVCAYVCVVLNSTQAHLPFLFSLFRTTLQADFSWSIKAENETVESLGSGDKKAYEDKSYYILQEDYAIARTYRCVANNTAGPGAFCEIEVAGECKDAFKNIRREQAKKKRQCERETGNGSWLQSIFASSVSAFRCFGFPRFFFSFLSLFVFCIKWWLVAASASS